MTSYKTGTSETDLRALYDDYTSGAIDRRDFMRRAVALGVAGAAAAALGPLASPADAAALAQQTAGAADPHPARRRRVELHVGEREARRDRARRVRRRAADVRRVHDSRAGPSSVSRRARARRRWPGHGLDGHARRSSWLVPVSRSGRLQGVRRRSTRPRTIAAASRNCTAASRRRRAVLENIAGRFTPPSANPAQTPNEYQKNHNQWPGVGNVGSPDLDQLVAGQGGSYVCSAPAGAGGRRAARRWRPRAEQRPVPDEAAAPPPQRITQPAGHRSTCSTGVAAGRRGSARQDRPGDHHDALGGRSIRAARRRSASESGEGDRHHRRRRTRAFAGGNRWGMSSIPVTYDPPVTDPCGDQDALGREPGVGVAGYFLQDGARAQAAESAEHARCVLRDRRLVVRVARQSRRRGVSQAGGRAGRGAAAGQRSASRATAT